MSRWNNGEEEDVLVDHRTSSPIMSVPTAALISPDDFVNQECRALVRCEHGRMLRHAPEPTNSTAATSGRPSGLHPTASHTATMVAPFDPGVRAARVGGFIFGGWDSHSRTLQVQAEKAGISLIAGVLMGKILVFLHFPPARRNPSLYQ